MCAINIDSFNDRIIKLWREYEIEKKLTLSPLLYHEPEKGGLLFISLNPSFNPKDSATRRLYQFADINENRDKIIKKHEYDVNSMPFFQPFLEISENVIQPCAQMDLFYYRESNQSKFEKEIFDNKKLNRFGCDQLNISKDIIAYINPKIIVVTNARARDILKGDKGYVPSAIQVGSFNEDYGAYLMGIDNNKCPTFFTGYMSTDKGTIERLKWHIRYVLRKDHKIKE
jgi:hypothetical protein